jgi:hypothetical protein
VALNLHAVVSGAIGAINPFIPAALKRSDGYTTADDGTQIPQYSTFNLMIQVQNLTNKELSQIEGLNIQNTTNAVYLSGDWNGTVRVGSKGGDLLIFNDKVWLAVTVLENWPLWTKLAVVLQNGV